MNLRKHLAVGILTLLTVRLPFAQGPDDAMATVKRLYESASYEEALSALGRMGAETHDDEIDEYSALCLLGLNREREAERAVERMVLRQGSKPYDVTNHPPKFVTLYHSVRKRTLPLAAAALFGSAKSSFEHGLFAIASAQFKELLMLLSDPQDGAAMHDLRMLSEGFLMLSEKRLIDVSPPVPEFRPAATPVRASPANSLKEVYGSEDLDVVPPEIIDQRMPKWIPAVPLQADQVFRGTLEIIVGKGGLVEFRTMSEPVNASYDWELLQATRQWRYKPATKAGTPVKYRKVIDVILTPKT
jgi:hypothetical protein